MNLITLKLQAVKPQTGSTIAHRFSRRLLKVVSNWAESQSILKHQWELYCATATRHHVPYRVWLRHGAYLEMKSRSQSH